MQKEATRKEVVSAGHQPTDERARVAAPADNKPPGRILRPAAGLSLMAALVHLWAMPEHLREWWAYGAFFLLMALAQGMYGAALLRWPRKPLFLAGIAGNLSILSLYVVSRTAGVPFFGPHAWHPEAVGVLDLAAATAEVSLVVALVALARGPAAARTSNLWRLRAATALAGTFAAVMVLTGPTVFGGVSLLGQDLLSSAQAQSTADTAGCSGTNFNRSYNVAAISVKIPYNRYAQLGTDPSTGERVAKNINEHGEAFVLQGDKAAVKNWYVKLGATPAEDPAKADNRRLRPRPLVIRANAGECVKVNFTNELDAAAHDGLPANRRASMRVSGVAYNAQVSDGSRVGFNKDTTVGIGESITYYWQAPKEEGLYFFRDEATTATSEANGGSISHGLYGAFAVEPKDSKWRDPETGKPLYTGDTEHDAITKTSGDPYVDADIVPLEGKAFRETVQISQDEIPNNIGMGFNYGSEPQENREQHMIPDGVGEEVSLSSWAFGDPSLIKLASGIPTPEQGGWLPEPNKDESGNPIKDADGHPILISREDCGLENQSVGAPATPDAKGSCYVSNVTHTYRGDPSKVRYLHAGPKETHVFHMHAHQWLSEPKDSKSNTIDSQTYGPGESFTADLIGGSGSTEGTIGDSIFHCHLYPHFADGFWSLFRTHDVRESGKPEVDVPGSGQTPDGVNVRNLEPLPNNAAVPAPKAHNPGYPRFIPGKFGWRAPQPAGGISEPSGAADVANTPAREDLKPATRIVAGKALDPGNTPLATLEQQRASVESEKAPLQSQLDTAVTDRATAQSQLDAAKAELDTAQTDLAADKAQRTDLQAQLDAARLKLGRADDPATAENEASGLIGQRDAKQAQYDTNCTTDPTTAECQNLKAEIDNLNNQIATLQKQISNPDDPNTPANESGLEQKIAALDTKIADLNTRISDLNTKIASLNSQISSLDAKIADLNTQIAPKDERIAILKKLILERQVQNFNYTGDANTNGNIKPGAAFTDPCPTGAREVTYNASVIQTQITYNEAGWHDKQARIVVPNKDVEAVLSGQKAAEPIFFRVNAGDCINFNLTNRVPNWFGGDAFVQLQQTNMYGAHIHLVKFDVTSSDGSSNGWNYQGAAFSKDQMEFNRQVLNGSQKCNPVPGGCRIQAPPPGFDPNKGTTPETVGQTIHERWYADTELRTVFTHDHHFAAVNQNRGEFGALLVEPAGMDSRNPWTGAFYQPINNPANGPVCGSACEGTAVGTAMDIIGPGTKDDFREFGLAYQDFVSLHTPGGEPIAPPEAPEHFPDADPGIMGINYRNAPFKIRNDNKPNADPAHIFSSNIHGDPKTPILNAYTNDPVRMRLIQGSHEEQHSFSVQGMRWLKEPNNPNSPLVNTQALGISEAFNFHAPAINCDTKQPSQLCMADLLYGGAATDDLYLGAWGLMRVRGELGKLLPLPDYPIQNKFNGDVVPPGATGIVPSLPAGSAGGAPCPTTAPAKTFKVVAMEAKVPYNKYGDHDPFGLIYALSQGKETPDQTVARVKAQGKYEPLTIRANEGDCINITLYNKLTSNWLTQHGNAGTNGDPSLPLEGPAGTRTGLRVSLHPQLVKYDPRFSNGANVGFSFEQTVAPGGSISYRYYADNVNPGELGATNLLDFGDVRGHRHHGLFAGLNIEPTGSTYHNPFTGAQITSGASADIRVPGSGNDFREFTTFFQDGLNLRDKTGAIIEDPLDHPPTDEDPDGEPLDSEDQGEKGFNYGSEPFRNRLGIEPTTASGMTTNPLSGTDLAYVFSSTVHGDPATPIFRAYAGDRIRMRLLQGADKPRQHSFQLAGSNWRAQPNDPLSPLIGNQGGISVARGENVHLNDGTGGAGALYVGDYRYGSGVLFHHLSGGLWGILRAYNPTTSTTPTPIGAQDDPNNAANHPIMPLEP